MRDSPDRKYTRDWLQYERQQPMYDESITEFYENVRLGGLGSITPDSESLRVFCDKIIKFHTYNTMY